MISGFNIVNFNQAVHTRAKNQKAGPAPLFASSDGRQSEALAKQIYELPPGNALRIKVGLDPADLVLVIEHQRNRGFLVAVNKGQVSHFSPSNVTTRILMLNDPESYPGSQVVYSQGDRFYLGAKDVLQVGHGISLARVINQRFQDEIANLKNNEKMTIGQNSDHTVFIPQDQESIGQTERHDPMCVIEKDDEGNLWLIAYPGAPIQLNDKNVRPNQSKWLKPGDRLSVSALDLTLPE